MRQTPEVAKQQLRAVIERGDAISGTGFMCCANFHAIDGSGYAFLADRIIELDRSNPQIASRLVTPLSRWRKFDDERQALMRAQLSRILAEKLSPDVYEVVSKSLA